MSVEVDVHRAIRTGCLLSLTIAAVVALTEFIQLQRATVTEEMYLNANVQAVAQRSAEALRQVRFAAEQQRDYWKVYGRKISETMDSTRATIDTTNRAVGSLNVLLADTNTRLNGATGVLTQLSTALAKLPPILDDADRLVQATKPEDIQAIVASARTLMANLADGSAESKQMLAHLNVSAQEMEGILYDLQHPERPSKWVRAVNIMLAILRGASMTRQSLGR